MTPIEVQDYIHVYSMLSFRDGKKEPGILVNKYNVSDAKVEYYFVHHDHMSAYKAAFDRYDRVSCQRLSTKLEIEDILNIRPVSLADYKMMMQLLQERNQQLNMMR